MNGWQKIVEQRKKRIDAAALERKNKKRAAATRVDSLQQHRESVSNDWERILRDLQRVKNKKNEAIKVDDAFLTGKEAEKALLAKQDQLKRKINWIKNEECR